MITALAFFTRFYKLNHPNEVVFDEVHFGKFASYVSIPLFFLSVVADMAVLAEVVFLRCPSSDGEDPVRVHGLVDWI